MNTVLRAGLCAVLSTSLLAMLITGFVFSLSLFLLQIRIWTFVTHRETSGGHVFELWNRRLNLLIVSVTTTLQQPGGKVTYVFQKSEIIQTFERNHATFAFLHAALYFVAMIIVVTPFFYLILIW